MKKVIGGYFILALFLFFGVLKSGLFLSPDFLSGGFPPHESIRTGFLTWFDPYMYGGTTFVYLRQLHPLMFLADFLPKTHSSIYLIFVHVWIAGVGMYLFLRKYGEWGAVFSGMAYMFTGMICSLVFAGHEGKIMVSAYLPWLFWCIDNMDSWRWAIWAGIIGGMAALTFHTQLCYYTIVFCFIYYLFRRKNIKYVLLALLISAAMYSPLLLAQKKLLADSTRKGNRTYEAAITYSMPPEEIMCSIEPNIWGQLGEYHGRKELKQHTEYMGFLVVIFMIWGVFTKSKLRWPMIVVGLCSLIVSLGGYTPIYKLIYMLPPNGMFRSPSMAFIGFSFAGCALASQVIKKWDWKVVLLLTLFTYGDLYATNRKYIVPVTFEQVYSSTEPIARFISADKSDFRIWAIDPQINDNRWGYYKIKSVGGNYPMPRASFVDSLGRKPGSILPDYHLMTIDRMKELNVKYIIISRPVYNSGLKLVYLSNGYGVYEVK